MKRFTCLTLLIMSSALIAVSQTSMTPGMQNTARKSPVAEYVGSWIGTFQGHTWISVRLVNQGGTLTGTLQRPRELQFQDSGELKSIGEETSTQAIQTATLQGDGLILTVKDPGTQNTAQYVMRLMSANTAEMKMASMAMAPGMPKPRPWQLSRVGPSAIAPVR